MLEKLKSRGLLYSVGIVFNRLVPEFLFRFRIFCIFRFRRPDAPPDISDAASPDDDGIRFVWCDNEEQFGLAKELTYFRPPQHLDQKCHSDQQPHQQAPLRACLAFDGDQAVGGVWIANGSFEESELALQIELQPDQCWLFAANIAKSHRRRGIYGRLLRYVLSTLGTAGVHPKVLASINPTNLASMAAHRPMIDETLGKCVAVRFLSIGVCTSNGKLKTTRSFGLGKETAIKVG